MYSDGVNPRMVIHQTTSSGAVLLAGYTGDLPTTTPNGFSVGCILVDNANKITYRNNGTTTVPVWTSMSTRVIQVNPATVATTGNTDGYFVAPQSGTITGVMFSGVDVLAASDTNYLTFSATNLGQAGAGTTVLLAATDANTTKATGGTALAANTRRNLTLSTTAASLIVAAGDRIRFRAAATGTLANTVTFPVVTLLVDGSAV